ncbi:cobalamin biosynthesis protein [Chelativorans intermedius]|uniref:cobalamin biosynthesis protein n=1 Tax=Chelativorans intermedius TaxID=515947 RepID=UPI0021BE56CB|nr:cobalamin biosynthesis protein [Chelativorans intermedius]MCT8997096.1 cobalamin biosynthesis protein [Chelativorans intermedius]
MRVAGLGCRKGVAAGEVLAALDACAAALRPPAVQALATAASKAGEPGILAAAGLLGLPLIPVDRAALRRASPRCMTHSAASLAATGTPSLAEAAALAAAGEGSRLIAPRIARGNVTCAIAQAGDET